MLGVPGRIAQRHVVVALVCEPEQLPFNKKVVDALVQAMRQRWKHVRQRSNALSIASSLIGKLGLLATPIVRETSRGVAASSACRMPAEWHVERRPRL